MGLRGQAELLSTVIIVSVAVALALGVIYYLLPLAAQGSVQQQIRSILSQITGSLVVATPSVIENDTAISAIVVVRNIGGAGDYMLYMGVVGLDNASVPLVLPNATFYELNGSVASLNGTAGWVELAPGVRVFNITLDLVWLFIRNDYYRAADLARFDANDTIALASLGLFHAGDLRTFRVDVVKSNTTSVSSYVVVVFTLVNGEFYEVARVVLAAG